MRRFKACQLLTLQKTLKRSLKYTHRLQKEMEKEYHVPFDHGPVNKSTFLNTDDLIESVYTRLQTLFLLEQKALRYNLEYHLQTSVGTLSPYLQRLMCQLGAVLRSGNIYRDKPLGHRCIVAEFIPGTRFSRKAALNSIVDFVLNSKYLHELTIANIKHILAQV